MKLEFASVQDFCRAFNAGAAAVRQDIRTRTQLEFWLLFCRIEGHTLQKWQEAALLDLADDPERTASIDAPEGVWRKYKSYWRAIRDRERRQGAPRQERLHERLQAKLKGRRHVARARA